MHRPLSEMGRSLPKSERLEVHTFPKKKTCCMRMNSSLATAIITRQFFSEGGFGPWPGLDPFLFCKLRWFFY